MKTSAILSTAALAVFGFSSLGNTVQARHVESQYVDQMARNIQAQATRIFRFARQNAHYDPRFRHVANDARSVVQAATHIHRVAHNSRGRRFEVAHIRRDAMELDRLVHHLQNELARMGRWSQGGHGAPIARGNGRIRLPFGINIAVGNRGVGHGGVGHGSFGHGPDYQVRQLQRQAARLSSAVHTLLEGVGIPCGY